MQVEIKNVKYAAFASEETSCFEATVYIDGKRVGTVGNDGHGGCHRWHPHTLQTALDDHAKATLPPETMEWDDPNTPGQKFVLHPDGEMVVNSLLDDFLLRRDLTRILAKKVAYVGTDDKLYTTKALDKARLALVLTKPEQFKNAKVILNTLPFDEAAALYRAHG